MDMKIETIELVDRGRGLQLSTTRITVQDLVPYFQEGCSHDEIIRWMTGLQEGNMLPAIAAMNDMLTRYPKETHIAYLAVKALLEI